ncbi:hypothetical protein JVU11DRAFT_10759 [Chiua virens]|nr:hypothetical protein JVU11DRAFT_10759 [Chiua virens]
MVTHYFWDMVKENHDIKGSNAMVQDKAMRMIAPPLFKFIQENQAVSNLQRNFRAPFIVDVVAIAHLSKTSGAVGILSLRTEKLQQGYDMEGVVALATAALERAFMLYRDSKVFVREAVKELAGKKKVTLHKTLNKATGTLSKQDLLFSHVNWGKLTDGYTNALIKKGPENTAEIIQTALDTLGPRAPETSKNCNNGDVIDPRSLLW